MATKTKAPKRPSDNDTPASKFVKTAATATDAARVNDKLNAQSREIASHLNGSGDKVNITTLENAAGNRDDFNATAFQILGNFFQYYDLVISKADPEKQANMMCVLTLIRRSNIKPEDLAELHSEFSKQPSGWNKMMQSIKNFTTIKAGGDFDSIGKYSKKATDKDPIDALATNIRFGIEPVAEEMKLGERRQINRTTYIDVPPIIDLVRQSFNRLIKTMHEIVEAMFNHFRLPPQHRNKFIKLAFDHIKSERGWRLEGSVVDNTYVDDKGRTKDDKGAYNNKHPDVKAYALLLFKQKVRISIAGPDKAKPIAPTSAPGEEPAAVEDDADAIFPWVELTDGEVPPGKATHFYAKRRTTTIADEKIRERYDKTEIKEMKNSKLYAIEDKSLIIRDNKDYLDPKNREKAIKFFELVGYQYVPVEYKKSDKTPYVLPEPEGEELEAIQNAKPEKPFVRQVAPNGSLVCLDLTFGPYINMDGKMGIHIRFSKDVKVAIRVFKRRLQEDFDVLKDFGVIRDISDIPPEFVINAQMPFVIQEADQAEAEERTRKLAEREAAQNTEESSDQDDDAASASGEEEGGDANHTMDTSDEPTNPAYEDI